MATILTHLAPIIRLTYSQIGNFTTTKAKRSVSEAFYWRGYWKRGVRSTSTTCLIGRLSEPLRTLRRDFLVKPPNKDSLLSLTTPKKLKMSSGLILRSNLSRGPPHAARNIIQKTSFLIIGAGRALGQALPSAAKAPTTIGQSLPSHSFLETPTLVRTLCFEKSLGKIAGMAVEFPTFPIGGAFAGPHWGSTHNVMRSHAQRSFSCCLK